MGRSRQQYRKLPGRRRGFVFGSSVWLGSDHVLLVKSSRFREEYKRFFFRDIQAIATAEAPRFHLSTRSALIGVLWSCALGFASRPASALPGAKWVIGFGAFLLLLVWAYLSARHSCRCRIYTAVSSEELPSLYRAWTARRFLERVQPYLTQAQGVIDGDWAEAAEARQIGPMPEGRTGLTMPDVAVPLPPPPAATTRSAVSTLFVAGLCLGGLAGLLGLGASANGGQWILLGFVLLQLAAAVAVLVQNCLGKLRSSMRNLAIVALASTGVWYYAAQFEAAASVGYRSAAAKNRGEVQAQLRPLMLLNSPVSRKVAGGMELILGLAGVILLLRGERQSEEKKVSFNV